MTGGGVVNGINDVGWRSGVRSGGREACPKSGLMRRLSPPLSSKQAHQKKQTPLQNMAHGGIWGGVCLISERTDLSLEGVFKLHLSWKSVFKLHLS